MKNMVLIVFLTLNMIQNQIKEKSTDMNTSMNHSYNLLRSVDVGVKILKCNIQFIFIHLILQGFCIRVNIT